MEFNIVELLVAFAGGIFGAAIGALPVWILCGLAVLIGATVQLSTGQAMFTSLVAWGAFLGPHTSFAGGAAAAAYAAKQKKLENGRDILTPLIGLNCPKVLMVGGIFGALGYVMLWGIMQVPNYSEIAWTNTIALAVVLNMVVARYAFGSTGLFGKVAKGANRWVPSDSAGWVPYQSHPLTLILLALAVGIPASYFTLAIEGSIGVTFGFVTFLLIFMQFGFKVPVTHHIALSAAMITAATGDITWGVTFGVMAAYIGEFMACTFVYHGDTHIDPPTLALVTTFTIYPLMDQMNAFSLAPSWVTAILAGVTILGYFALCQLKKEKSILNLSLNRK
ncbi:permease [Prolixibacteraceae bacterium JC049]|nr:permease [Prolixibacteraceae bacterium JC049]